MTNVANEDLEQLKKNLTLNIAKNLSKINHDRDDKTNPWFENSSDKSKNIESARSLISLDQESVQEFKVRVSIAQNDNNSNLKNAYTSVASVRNTINIPKYKY